MVIILPQILLALVALLSAAIQGRWVLAELVLLVIGIQPEIKMALGLALSAVHVVSAVSRRLNVILLAILPVLLVVLLIETVILLRTLVEIVRRDSI